MSEQLVTPELEPLPGTYEEQLTSETLDGIVDKAQRRVREIIAEPGIDPDYSYRNIDSQGRDQYMAEWDLDSMRSDILTDDEHSALQSIENKIAREGEELADQGEKAYAHAHWVESVFGEKTALAEYKRAGRLLVASVGARLSLNTHNKINAVNPVTYFKIADALTKQAEADGTDQEFMLDGARRRTDRRTYLSGLAIESFNRGIDGLHAGGQVVDDTDIKLPENPEEVTEMVASNIAEAAADIDDTREHAVLAPEGERKLAARLSRNGAEELKRGVEDLAATDLEVISLSSQRINRELTGDHSFELAA